MRRALPMLRLLAFALALACASADARADDAEAAWSALARGGHVALLRHANAPGIGDPAGFRLDDCATQRNLDHRGRTQAGRIGDAFRARAIRVEQVLSSRWCRCRETARLLRLGPVTPDAALDSFFTRPVRRDRQTEALRRFASGQSAGNRVLVTHQVNISALVGGGVASGEIVVVKPLGANRFRVVGRIPAP